MPTTVELDFLPMLGLLQFVQHEAEEFFVFVQDTGRTMNGNPIFKLSGSREALYRYVLSYCGGDEIEATFLMERAR